MPQPNMNQMLKQVQKMQQDMMAAQEQLANETVQSSAGGGMVTVTVTGDLVVKSITIDPDAIDPEDPELLQDMVLAESLKVAHPAALTDGELTLAWAETHGLSKRKAEDAANRELIGRAIRAVTGASLRLAHELRDDATEEQQATLSTDELIERFVEEFEAEILPEEEPEETS